MAAEKPHSGGDELAALDRWPEALGNMHARVARRFRRPEVRERVCRYLAGLLGRVERKNSWQMAEQMGEMGPQGAQRLLNAARWDADAVRDDLREYVVEHLGDEDSGVLIVDETGFLKKGKEVRWGSPPVHGHGGQEGELPGWGVFGVRLEERGGVCGPVFVPTTGVDRGCGAASRGRSPAEDPVRHQGGTSQGDAPSGV